MERREELRRRIKNTFDAQGIELPYPHISVYTGEATKPFPVTRNGGIRDGGD